MVYREVIKPDKNEKWDTYASIKLVCVDPADVGLIFGQCVTYLEKRKARFNACVNTINLQEAQQIVDGGYGFFFANDICATQVVTAAEHLDMFDLWVVEITSIRNTKTLNVILNKLRRYLSQGKCQCYQVKKHDTKFKRIYLSVGNDSIEEMREGEINAKARNNN